MKRWFIILSILGVLPVFSIPCRASESPCPSPTPAPMDTGGEESGGKQSRSTRYVTARNLHLKGVEGDDDAALRAREILEELAAEEPGNPLVIAYLGSSRVLEAKDAVLPWKKGELAKEGLKLLDRAVSLNPDNIEVRFVRGVSSYPLPFFFGVGDQAEEDFAFVVERLEKNPAAVRPPIAAAAFYYHGLCLEDDDREAEAIRCFKEAVAAAPGSTFAEKAREMLEEMEQ